MYVYLYFVLDKRLKVDDWGWKRWYREKEMKEEREEEEEEENGIGIDL